jgi:hypothetical protein
MGVWLSTVIRAGAPVAGSVVTFTTSSTRSAVLPALSGVAAVIAVVKGS